jgi:hypothetical protein
LNIKASIIQMLNQLKIEPEFLLNGVVSQTSEIPQMIRRYINLGLVIV